MHRRFPTVLLLALLTAVAGVQPAAATSWGIADQKPQTFTHPRFAELQDAGMRMARYVMRYDALRYADNPDRSFYAAQADAWLRAARAAGVRPLVTFTVTASGKASLGKTVPRARYLQEFKAFRRAYPWVRDFSLWNEANLSGPFRRRPQELGRLYRTVDNYLRKSCPDCRLLAADLHSTNDPAGYAEQVQRGAGRPIRIWGLNNYNDVNDGRSTATARFLRSPAVRRSRVWLTETGGVYRRSAKFEQRNPFLAQRRRARSDATRLRYQYDATRFLNRLVKRYRHRIQRAYVYQLQGEPDAAWRPGAPAGSWDSGLLDPTGEPRKSFGYVLRHVLVG